MKTFKLALIVIASLFLLLPLKSVFAQQSQVDSQTTICQRIGGVEKSMLVSIEAKRQQAITLESDSQKQTVADRLARSRSQADKIRAKHFTLLTGRLKNPDQKQAIENYQSSLNIAINTRRAAIDEAQAEYNSKLAELVNSHQLAVRQAEDALIGEVRKSFDTAKQACASDSNTMNIKYQLTTNLKTAKASFAQTKQSFSNGSLEYRELTQKRNQAVTKAVNEFKMSELQAREQLLRGISLNR